MNPFATLDARNTKSASAEQMMETLGLLAETAAKCLQEGSSPSVLIPAASQGWLAEIQSGALTCLMGTLRMGRKERSKVKQSVETMLGALAGANVAPVALMEAFKASSAAVLGALAEDLRDDNYTCASVTTTPGRLE